MWVDHFEDMELTINVQQEGPENVAFRDLLSRVCVGCPTNANVEMLEGRLLNVPDLDGLVDFFQELLAKGEDPVSLLSKQTMVAEFNDAVASKKNFNLT